MDIFAIVCINLTTLFTFIVYLRNKETQQKLRVVVDIQYGASF